ncbi:MAG: TolC family protein [Mucilaginibacter sp.]|uniref:TolC family protein n=1 Tax=Mucilaginibacter sp. TaxID=1882438 RepID=UPI0034E5AB12
MHFNISKIYCILFFTFCCPYILKAQTARDSLSPVVSLQECIRYALKNQPVLRQTQLDQEINERNIDIALSAWLPQLNGTGSLQHYFELPTSAFPNTAGGTTVTRLGLYNNSTLTLGASQVIYNNDVLLASRGAKYSRRFYQQNTQVSQVNTVADVSKAFYDVLLSQKQLDIINADIARLRLALKDAYAQYQAGVVDKIDYKQATIALNNALASYKATQEAVKSKTAVLRQFMGITAERTIMPVYDSVRLEQETHIDTMQMLDVRNRPEYQQLETQRNLQNLNVSYYKWGFLPSVGAFGNYNVNFLNNQFSDLYNKGFPNSLIGLNLSIPIFQGTRRLQNLRKARLQVDRADLDIVNLHTQINTEYEQALSNYKSSYFDLQTLKQNVDLSRDVYNVVFLQYREGIKTYLDVIVAQSDLRTSELNYNNALFTLLSSKIDLQRALGSLSVNY